MTEPCPSPVPSRQVAVSRPVRRLGRDDNVVSIEPYLDRNRTRDRDEDGLFEPVHLEQAYRGLDTVRFWRAEISADLFGCFIVEILSGSKGGKARVAIRSFADFDEAAMEVGRLCHEAMARGFRPLH
ncbi:WGR domain-containing protein [Aquibium sp. ELW1220]|uniref:WGR domain-containing protein n=1 Tax=Aquibium sp. ELW1220 TaxID=2976766 RepID=UPI0025B0FDC0|nr:WGR domain-containing protein [Aquibium sp. ELW1220]MDN2578957.1 WGR domain-containing protein [Aquibium sp. ELW1220]